MWQLVYNRAMVMLAQVSGGAQSATGAVSSPPGAGGSGYQLTLWHTLFLIIYFLICIGLVTAVLLQTTKNEGLSGIIGGSNQAVFKGKKGFEERLQEITNYLAVSFIILSFLLSIFMFRVK